MSGFFIHFFSSYLKKERKILPCRTSTTMRVSTGSILLVLSFGVASAFFRPAVPHQVENNVVAMNADLFGLDNPGTVSASDGL